MNFWYQTIDRIFIQPDRFVWLWLIGVSLFVIIAGELLRIRWRRRLFATARDPKAGTGGDVRRWARSTFRIAALLLIVLALADPRAGLTAMEVRTSKLQIVCLLDRSRSMMAQDVFPSRFETGRDVVRNVVDLAAGAAVAVATFAGDARIDVPLTRDYRGLLDRLDGITPDQNPMAGTSLGAGFATAATCFAERIESPKILIVITDGETHGVEPELPGGALPAGTETLVFGLGDPQRGARIPLAEGVDSGSGQDAFLRHEGKLVWSKANEAFLRRLADRLGGSFESLNNGSSAPAIVDILRRSEATATEAARLAYRRQAAPRFHWLLLAAVALLCLEMVLPLEKRAVFRLPFSARSGSAGQWRLWMLFCVSTPLVGLAEEPPGTAATSRRILREGNQRFNRGVEAYRAERWDDAEKLFRTVSRREGPLQTKAMFNLASTQYAIVNRGGISTREAISRLQESIELLRRVIAEGERTEDARANIELVYRRLLQIQQQQPDSGGESPPADEPPDTGAGSPDENGDEQKGNASSGNPRQGGGSDAGGGPTPDTSNGDKPPSAPGGDGERSPSKQEPSDSPDGPSHTEAPDRFGAGPSETLGPSSDRNEPLTEQEAEDQLSRIRQRARDRRGEGNQARPTEASPASIPSGLPW